MACAPDVRDGLTNYRTGTTCVSGLHSRAAARIPYNRAVQTIVQRAWHPTIRRQASSTWLALFLVVGGSSLLLGLLCVMLTAWLFRHERVVFGVTN